MARRQVSVTRPDPDDLRASAGAACNPVDALLAELAETGAFRLVTGTVSDVERRTTQGFVRGFVVVEGVGNDAGRLIRFELQNENLVALERGQVLASVPDLISVLDSETADAIVTERVRYGQRVTVIALRCDPIWRTEVAWRQRARARSATTSAMCPWGSSPVPS